MSRPTPIAMSEYPEKSQKIDLCVDHPWLGDGTPDAKPAHIVLAVRLMWHSVIVFTLFEVFLIGMLSL